MDPTRAFLFLNTNGEEGATPHLASDVLSALKKKFGNDAVGLLAVNAHQLYIKFTVNDVVYIVEQVQGASATCVVYRAQHPTSGAVRFDATTTVPIPCIGSQTFHPIPVKWKEQWPTASDLAEPDVGQRLFAYAQRLSGTPWPCDESLLATVWSDKAIIVAIETLIELSRQFSSEAKGVAV